MLFEHILGYSVIKDMNKAVFFYEKSSMLGHPGATVNLSNCYDSGDGVVINKGKVFELDNIASSQNHPIAINNLGCCYLFGKGCEVNHSMKVKLWKKASDMGYSMSQVNLGISTLAATTATTATTATIYADCLYDANILSFSNFIFSSSVT